MIGFTLMVLGVLLDNDITTLSKNVKMFQEHPSFWSRRKFSKDST
jgi:hypothetical protein